MGIIVVVDISLQEVWSQQPAASHTEVSIMEENKGGRVGLQECVFTQR